MTAAYDPRPDWRREDRELIEVFAVVRVSRGPDRYRVTVVATGEVVGVVMAKARAELDARGRNRIASKSAWCPMHRAAGSGSVLCGGTVPAYGVCERVHEHV